MAVSSLVEEDIVDNKEIEYATSKKARFITRSKTDKELPLSVPESESQSNAVRNYAILGGYILSRTENGNMYYVRYVTAGELLAIGWSRI